MTIVVDLFSFTTILFASNHEQASEAFKIRLEFFNIVSMC